MVTNGTPKRCVLRIQRRVLSTHLRRPVRCWYMRLAAISAAQRLESDPMARYKSPTTRPELLAAVKRHLQLVADGRQSEAAELLGEWEEFYGLYDQLLRRFCHRLHFCQKDTDDLLQTVWLKVHNTLANEFHYKPGPGKFRALLRTIVKHTGIDEAEKLRNQRKLGASGHSGALAKHEDEKAEDPTQVFEREEECAKVQAVIEFMEQEAPPGEYAVFHRRRIKEESTADVAEALGISEEAVRKRLERAMLRFYRTYRRMHPDDEIPEPKEE